MRATSIGRQRDTLFSIAFLSPALILYSAFIVAPIFVSVYYSLSKYRGVRTITFVGLANYGKIFQDPDFWLVLKNSVILVACSVVFHIILAIAVAYLIYRSRRGFRYFRGTAFLPVVVSGTAVAVMFGLFFNSEFGPINQFLEAVGLEFLARQWLSDPGVVLYSVITPMIWKALGFYIVLFLAGLQGIPVELFESAFLDGARSSQVFRKIVVPLQFNIIQISVILVVTGSLKAFDMPWLMTNGGPGNRSGFLGTLMYKTAFRFQQFGRGSAVAITILILALVFTIGFRILSKRSEFEY